MNKVLQIYRDDFLSIVKNWAAAAIILALMILPSLYAWFNIEASWDPYGNTGGIPIAVVNNDAGAVLKGRKINIGLEVVKALKTNHSLGWRFVSSAKANTGVKQGSYFASITIPKDFSAKIATILQDDPEKPELIYTVNEKTNAITPKITAKGATSLQDEISKNFVKTATGVIFSIFNQLGIELQKNLPNIEKLKTMIFWLNDHLAEAETIINTADYDAAQAQKIVENLQMYVTEVQGIINQVRGLAGQINQFFEQNQQTFANLVPAIKQNLLYMQQNAASIEQLTSLLPNLEAKKNTIDDSINRLETLIKIENLLISLFENLNGLGNNAFFHSQLTALISQKQSAESLLKLLTLIQSQTAPSQALLDQANQTAKNVSTGITQMLDDYDGAIASKIKQLSNTAKNIPTKATEFFLKADQTLPQVKKILLDASNGIAIGRRDIALIKQDFPGVKQKISYLANQIRQFEKTANINEIIDLLRNDVEKESDYFAEPVLLKEKRLYPIPNYGSAMSPFFTTLSLWVGAMLLISLIPAEMNGMPEIFRPHHLYLGRFLTFLSVALCQSIIVTLGDIYLLKAYVAAKLWFVLFGLLISTLFMLITYTLVSIFGNVGKGLAIVILVLQISGAGGTFPIQVMPAFFQRLNPLLPFTYGISLMREAVGGIQWDVAIRDLFVFLFISIITLLFGLLLQEPIDKWGGKLKRKARESRLIH
ncbi:YhgE/Pip domain-containing protein [Bacillus sp. BRMEA1]|uniref:YhgE/Pip domain-containing protein n=1 Tax=Neobacillus endophyticus TaxID=2738405 RepID=UPI0015641B4C|nr:YhgE/Pip domain-containing protein [Neobacillus endophyticus]NRD78251.1 YhgE/Pip domain-containing protein [Neobacillus endophyticus]